MRRRWVEQFAVIVALCAVAGTANAQGAPEPLPAPGASDVARTVTPGFRFVAPAQAAAITADRLQLFAPDGVAVRGLVRTSGDRAVLEQPVGLEGNRLQIRLAGPYSAAFLGNSSTIALQNRQNLASTRRIFASILQVRQAAGRTVRFYSLAAR